MRIGWSVTDHEGQSRLPSRDRVGAVRDSRGTTRLAGPHRAVADHIACSSTTRSEIVVPIMGPQGELVAVLDIDSDELSAFDAVDETHLQRITKYFDGRGCI